MNIGLDFLWWLDLDNQVNVWDVQATRCHISSDQHFKFTFFKALHGHFTLVLNDITVHHLNILLNFISQNKSVCISFCLGKDDGLSLASITNQNISQSRQSVLVGATNSQVLHFLGCLVFKFMSEIDDSSVLLHVVVGNRANPCWDGG